MLKTRLIAALAIGSLALSPAVARETRSADTVPRANPKALEVASQNSAIHETFVISCQAPGNGRTTGHGQGAGQSGEHGNGRTCPPKSPG